MLYFSSDLCMWLVGLFAQACAELHITMALGCAEQESEIINVVLITELVLDPGSLTWRQLGQVSDL